MSITSLIVTPSHKPSPGISEFNCRTSVPSLQVRNDSIDRVVTYVEQGRGSGDWRSGVHLHTNGTPCKRVLIVRILALPFVPDLIDHLNNVHVSTAPTMKQLTEPYRVMKEKHGIYMKGGSRFRISTCIQPKPKPPLPFEDHFVPMVHVGGCNPNGHDPTISPPSIRCGPG